MTGAALLDVNVLVALFDPGHVHHDEAHDWFADCGSAGWATCPVTEAGFIRVFSALRPGALRPARLAAHLHTFCESTAHQFWPDAIALTDTKAFDLTYATHRNLTDVYLLGLAHHRRGRLVTFDRSIPVKAVRGARSDILEVIARAE